MEILKLLLRIINKVKWKSTWKRLIIRHMVRAQKVPVSIFITLTYTPQNKSKSNEISSKFFKSQTCCYSYFLILADSSIFSKYLLSLSRVRLVPLHWWQFWSNTLCKSMNMNGGQHVVTMIPAIFDKWKSQVRGTQQQLTHIWHATWTINLSVND